MEGPGKTMYIYINIYIPKHSMYGVFPYIWVWLEAKCMSGIFSKVYTCMYISKLNLSGYMHIYYIYTGKVANLVKSFS